MRREESHNNPISSSNEAYRPLSRLLQPVFLAILLLSFVLASILAHKYNRFPVDLSLALYIQTLDSGFVRAAMKIVSQIGGGQIATALLLAMVLLFWLKHMYTESIFLLGAGLLNSSEKIFKIIVDRPRPSPDLVSVVEINYSGSFPSGHAALSMVLFGAIFYFSGIYIHCSVARKLVQFCSAALILLTGISRILSGAHWPSDVLGGYLLGGITLTLLIILHKKTKETDSKSLTS